ncbi:MAG TPA: hypothetical protein VFU02_14750 [Polyangiaceae bacterium]|nr:hypothetical protein [Polyangiaceae bacterium]
MRNAHGDCPTFMAARSLVNNEYSLRSAVTGLHGVGAPERLRTPRRFSDAVLARRREPGVAENRL